MGIGMYIRTISRKNKGGSAVTYVQLAHNLWDPRSRCAKAQVLHTFGRTDELDTDALKRLAQSINRFLSPEDALHGNASGGAPWRLCILFAVFPWAAPIFCVLCGNNWGYRKLFLNA